MIKAFIFDFDGVLIESAKIKTEAFRKIFSKWPEKVDNFIFYHRKNMGISRYVKFKYFYKNIIGKPYSKEIENKLGKQFSELVAKQIKKADFVEGAKEFLEESYRNHLLFIASGTPQKEIENIISYKGIGKYFRGIFGAPLVKIEIIENILKSYLLKRKEVVFVGDAESDRIAAAKTRIYFIMRINSENRDLVNSSVNQIYDLTQLNNKIEEIEDKTFERV